MVVDISSRNTDTSTSLRFLDYARLRYGGKHPDQDVDDVSKLSSILTVFLSLIP